MKRPRPRVDRRYQLWIGRVGTWRPQRWHDLPPRFVAQQPADDVAYSARHALAFIEGFNHQMLASGGRHWAVALAVEIRSAGEPGCRACFQAVNCAALARCTATAWPGQCVASRARRSGPMPRTRQFRAHAAFCPRDEDREISCARS